MPKRPQEHRLEEEAIAMFKLAVQPRWLVRDKDGDYGIDLEAELFSADDTSTGQLFYVQSKATGSADRERTVTIQIDRLRYLSSFEPPGMVVRYCAPKKSMHWMWATEALYKVKPGAKTVTISFSDEHLWHDDTPAKIERALPVFRTLKRLDPKTKFTFRSTNETETLTVQRIADRLGQSFPGVFGGRDAIPIDFDVSPNQVGVSIEGVLKTSCPVSSEDIFDLETASMYVLVTLFSKIEHIAQASNIALHCLNAGRTVQNDALATVAAVALLRHVDTERAVDLAILNGLHDHQELGHSIFRSWLTLRQADQVGIDQAFIRFYEEAIAALETRNEPIGAIRYSLANYLYNHGLYARAVVQYKLAGRDEPDYWNRPYFLCELGAAFFFARRYSASVRAYECAFNINPDERTRFTLADAALHACEFDRSRELFEPLVPLRSSLGAEAALKSGLADWAEQNGSISIGDLRTLFELRNAAANVGDHYEQFWAHLSITFFSGNDVPYWADSIALALGSGHPATLSCVMLMSVQRTGVEAYALFKEEHAVSFQMNSEEINSLDQAILDFKEMIAQERSPDLVTIRGPKS